MLRTARIASATQLSELGAAVVLGGSGAAVANTGDTNLNTIATLVIPANRMGANGVLRIRTLWSATNNANAKTAYITFGGTNYCAVSMANNATWTALHFIHNRNATNSQIGAVSTLSTQFALSAGANVTSAVDTTSNVNLDFKSQLGSGADTQTLEAWLVELVRTAA